MAERKEVSSDPSSCLRCGNCCTRFGVCISPFDILQITETTGLDPSEFVSMTPEPPDRERTEPPILIDGEPRLLILKWKRERICKFFSKEGCTIYDSRPMLCRTYPFRRSCFGPCVSRLVDMKSRACPVSWKSEDPQYEKDLVRYERELESYHVIAKKWNDGWSGLSQRCSESGDLASFLSFALHEIKKPSSKS